MSTTVCLSADTINYPEGGGHLWVYLNWALGLCANGCRVIWLEGIDTSAPIVELQARVDGLTNRLKRYGLGHSLALVSRSGEPIPSALRESTIEFETAASADLLLNIRYDLATEVVGRFRRSVLLDIDPGLLQFWMSAGVLDVARHDLYFSIGETVGKPDARFPDAGIRWEYTPPCVALNCWQPHAAAEDAPFTTVSHWYEDEWVEDADGYYLNDKRSGFLPFLDLPQRTRAPLELAIYLGDGDDEEREELERHGWRVRHSRSVASTPWAYQSYIRQSRGEFSCVKPSCVRFQNAWISDRTLCYLASGKPAVIEHTGPSRFLPDAAGLFRFRDVEDAARCLESVLADYDHQCRLACALAEEYFDARAVTRSVLERALA